MTMRAAHVPAPMKPGPVVYSDQQLLRVLIRLAQGRGSSDVASSSSAAGTQTPLLRSTNGASAAGTAR